MTRPAARRAAALALALVTAGCGNGAAQPAAAGSMLTVWQLTGQPAHRKTSQIRIPTSIENDNHSHVECLAYPTGYSSKEQPCP
jgi:ABC-type glycerol-3-phosphate transport system substrate-binding protein